MTHKTIKVKVNTNEVGLERLYPKWNCPACGDWFHMPHKFCKCDEDKEVDLVIEGYDTEQADPDDNYNNDGGSNGH